MSYTVQARITPEVFQEFAWFDLLRHQKRLRAPLLFTLVMAAFAGVCFLAAGRVRGAGLLGGVLLGVGLVLPLCWLLSFHLSVRGEAKKLKLAQAPVAYTLRLTAHGLEVSNEKENAQFPWEQLHRVCRLRRSVCLYVTPGLPPAHPWRRGGRPALAGAGPAPARRKAGRPSALIRLFYQPAQKPRAIFCVFPIVF